MRTFKFLLLFVSVFSFMACSNGEQPLPGKDNGDDDTNIVFAVDSEDTTVFMLDGSTGTFDKNWYHYDEAGGHKIYTIFSLYLVQTPEGNNYKVQIANYYDPKNSNISGVYTLRIKPQGQK